MGVCARDHEFGGKRRKGKCRIGKYRRQEYRNAYCRIGKIDKRNYCNNINQENFLFRSSEKNTIREILFDPSNKANPFNNCFASMSTFSTLIFSV